jgi:Ca2+:H+ antiporter
MRRFLFSSEGWPYLLVPFIPIAVVFELAHVGAVPTFFASTLGVIPTAALMGKATEELAARAGPGIGGLLNVTFGNAPELIIALFALNAGLHEVVKASLLGSILGNALLVLGAAAFVGGLGRDRQYFDRAAASAQTTMLMLAVAALVMPAIFVIDEGEGLPSPGAEIVDYNSTVENLSLAVAGVLIVTYVAGLWFSLKTHRDLFNPGYEASAAPGNPAPAGHPHPASSGADAPAPAPARDPEPAPEPAPDAEEEHGEPWTVRRSIGALAIAGVAVGLMSEILVDSITETAEQISLSQFFIGAIVVAIVGNAAEHWVAVLVAAKNQMDLAVNIAIGSSAQIALFVAPVLVVCSFLLGPHPMPLVFNAFEVGGVIIAVLIASQVTNHGESTWYMGLQLLAVYVVLALTFLFA